MTLLNQITLLNQHIEANTKQMNYIGQVIQKDMDERTKILSEWMGSVPDCLKTLEFIFGTNDSFHYLKAKAPLEKIRAPEPNEFKLIWTHANALWVKANPIWYLNCLDLNWDESGHGDSDPWFFLKFYPEKLSAKAERIGYAAPEDRIPLWSVKMVEEFAMKHGLKVSNKIGE